MPLPTGQLPIFEVKTKTPFDPEWHPGKSWEELFESAHELAIRYGGWLSIHHEAAWGGSGALIDRAVHQSQVPVLAKGLHRRDPALVEAFGLGADFALVANREPAVFRDKCLLEPLTLDGLASLTGRDRAVWNARNPFTGETKLESFDQAREVRPEGILIQASKLRTIEDVHPEASGIIIATYIDEFAASLR